MKRTVNINLSGRSFHIDEDAFSKLRDYLDRLERYFSKQDEGKEIISDIESRIAEIFSGKINEKTGVVNIEMVEEVIQVMGQPEDFDGEESTSDADSSEPYIPYTKPKKRLYRDIDNRVFGGVCSGIAAYLNMDPVLVRVIFAFLPFLSVGIIIPIYVILWIVVPAAITTAQKLEMRGENVTISNIEKTIRNEYEDVKKQFNKFKQSDTYKKGESWWNKMTRNKTVVTVLVIAIGSVLFFNLGGVHTMGFAHNFHHVANPGVFSNVSMHFGHIPFFPFHGLFALVIILLVIGLIFKSIFKVILYFIAFVFLGSIALSVIGAIVTGVAFLF